MRLDVNKLSSAVRLALSLGVVATAGTLTANAQDTGSSSSPNSKGQKLETIVVTGSNIRRVDIETANPVVTIGQAQIKQSGKLTLGDLVQNLSSVGGMMQNPATNNGGGSAKSTVSLRGLGSSRTLLLIDGHRIPSFMQDLNLIPINAVDRIEVLSDGASAVYGSDAIGGVVNVILRHDYQGAEFSANYGISDQDDGERRGYQFTFGQATDKGSIMGGISYNKQDPVFAKDREFSKYAQYFYYGAFHKIGSSHTPGLRVTLPPNLASQFGCPFAHKKDLTSPGTSLSDYRCFSYATDTFNYQAVGNYDQVPQERLGAFLIGNYKLTDNVETYLQLVHNKTNANSQLAPSILNTSIFGLDVSANNVYNPFGVEFTPGQYEIRGRLLGVGNRRQSRANTDTQINAGFKVNFGETSWSGKLNFGYAHELTDYNAHNFVNWGKLTNALGPSFYDANGVPTCGTPDAPISGCTPIDIFNPNDPTQAALLKQFAGQTFNKTLYQMKEVDASVNGNLFDLPAGSVSMAAGYSYRKEHQNFSVDQVSISDVNGFCEVPSTCSSPVAVGFNVKEAYAEVLIPVLSDMPLVHSLNVDIGDRYSKYSNFGSTSNWKIAVEYRPIEDLLLRGTVSKVFRAPTISDIYAGPANSAPPFSDPCQNLAAGQTNPACQYITGPFISTATTQTNAIVSGAQYAGYNLGPENGKSFDFGFVYDPSFLPGLSVSADLYRIYLRNLILTGGQVAQIVATGCYQGVSSYCPLIHRFPSGASQGQINYINAPALNAGRLDTKGLDLSGSYRFPETRFGNFRVTAQATYLDQYTQNSGVFTQRLAGQYDATFGNHTRWRAIASLDWNMGPWSANWTARYIGRITIGNPTPELGPSFESLLGCYYGPNCIPVMHFGAYTYHNVSASYNIEPINTTVQVGIDNVGDKQPPIIGFAHNVNPTDVSTYDTVGRYYFANVTVKF